MSNFTQISSEYQHRAILQKSASEKLFDLLALRQGEKVLDLGCGPGHLTRKIRDLTDCAVLGIDPSEGMIAEARRNCLGLGIAFEVCAAESLDANELFDVVFCNSAFQWLRDPPSALHNCYRALRRDGRMGIQAPVRRSYCPNLIQAFDRLSDDPRTQAFYPYFRSPWCFLESADEYAQLFEAAGFMVESSWIEEVIDRCSPEKAFEMFEAGAAAGYLNPACYAVALPSRFIDAAQEIIASAFRDQAESDGKVSLTFFRIYLLARRT
jgi:trans-aconitate methyltransferase